MYPSAIKVPRFSAICARLTPPIGVGGLNWDTQFGLPVLSIALKNSPGVGTVSESIVTAAFSSASDNGEAAGVGELPPPACCPPKVSTSKMAMMLGKSRFQGGAICTAVYQQSRTCPALRSVSRLIPWSSALSRPRLRGISDDRLPMTNLDLCEGSSRRFVIWHLSFCHSWRGGTSHPSFKFFLYATPVSRDGFRRETRGCGDAKAECAGSAGCSRP